MNHNATLLAYALGTLGPSAVRSLLPRSFALDGERIILSSPAAMIVWDGKINPSLPFTRKAVELFFRRVATGVERYEMQWIRRAA